MIRENGVLRQEMKLLRKCVRWATGSVWIWVRLITGGSDGEKSLQPGQRMCVHQTSSRCYIQTQQEEESCCCRSPVTSSPQMFAWLLFLSLPGTQSCWGEQGVCVNTRYHHHFGCFYSHVPPSARETQSVRGWRRFNICGPLSLLVLSSLSIHTLTKSIHTLTKMQTLDLVLVSLKGAVCEYVHLSPTTEGRCAFIGFISMGVFTESSQGKHGMFSKAFRV